MIWRNTFKWNGLCKYSGHEWEYYFCDRMRECEKCGTRQYKTWLGEWREYYKPLIF